MLIEIFFKSGVKVNFQIYFFCFPTQNISVAQIGLTKTRRARIEFLSPFHWGLGTIIINKRRFVCKLFTERIKIAETVLQKK